MLLSIFLFARVLLPFGSIRLVSHATCTKSGKSAVMYLCVTDIVFDSFCFIRILESFRQCGVICFSFYLYVEAHDDSGPIPIQETAVTPLADIFLQGGEQIGYKSHDCNGDDGDIVGK